MSGSVIDPLQSAKRAPAPEKIHGAYLPVMAKRDDECPHQRARLQHAMSDSYSCSWVHDELTKS